MDLKNNQKREDKISNTKNDSANGDKIYRRLLTWISKTTITDWLIFVCTFVIAATSILQWKTLEKTNEMSGKQLKILDRTDQTSRLRDRAYVYFSNPIEKPYPKDKPIVLAIGIKVSNTGNMPAKNISIRCGYAISPTSKNNVDPFPSTKWSEVQSPEHIGPKQDLSLQGCEIPSAIIEQAIKSKVNIFVLMEVTYTDGFDPNKTRTTQMSRSLRFDKHGSYSWGFTPSHNCIDDDCN